MLSLLLLMQAIETPKTVNGQELGAIEDYRTDGPARICLANVALDLKENEQGYLQYSGIHHASMIIVTDGKAIEFFHRDSGASLSGNNSKLWWAEGNYNLWQSKINGKAGYTFVGHHNDEIDGVYFGSLRVSSDHFLEASDDEPEAEDWHYDFVKRIKIFDGDPPDCLVHYRYGWGVLLGEETLVEKSKSDAKK